MAISKRLYHRQTGKPMGFTFKRIHEEYFEVIKEINDSVIAENLGKEVFAAPSDEEIEESLRLDVVYGVFHSNELVGFIILVHTRETERDLSLLTDFKKEDCLTIDNVEVKKEFRGYGLEKEFIKLARNYKLEMGFVHLLAVVSKLNHASFKSFKRMSFKVIRSNVVMYGTYRELVDFVI